MLIATLDQEPRRTGDDRHAGRRRHRPGPGGGARGATHRPGRGHPRRRRGGAGASAAALLAAAAGARVSGCDPGCPDRLHGRARGAPASRSRSDPRRGARLDRRAHADCAWPSRRPSPPCSPTIRSSWPPALAGIAIEPWQQVVADAAASQGGRLVAVAGTHGKSTSSGWLVHLLTAAGRDPAAFVGALLPSSLTGGRAGHGALGEGGCLRRRGGRVRRQLRPLPTRRGHRPQRRVGPPGRLR